LIDGFKLGFGMTFETLTHLLAALSKK
jgi:hypothetical protein